MRGGHGVQELRYGVMLNGPGEYDAIGDAQFAGQRLQLAPLGPVAHDQDSDVRIESDRRAEQDVDAMPGLQAAREAYDAGIPKLIPLSHGLSIQRLEPFEVNAVVDDHRVVGRHAAADRMCANGGRDGHHGICGAEDAALARTPDGKVLQPAISGRFIDEWRVDLEDVRDAERAAAFLSFCSVSE